MLKYYSFLFLILSTIFVAAQNNIQGVINMYTKVTAIDTSNCYPAITLINASNFSIGDTVLLIQMKGAIIDTTNTANFGNILGLNSAGSYEFSIIGSINNNLITLKTKLLHQYDPAQKVQLVTVPVYTNATISGILTAAPWDGNTGGVLVFDVAGTLTFNANINVSDLGFKGGSASLNYFQGCTSTSYVYPFPSNHSGEKGEGIAEYGNTYRSGRGALANGGGGGNHVNAGGGGGSNIAAGGTGGDQWANGTCNQIPIGGEGGKALNFVPDSRLFLGGGGGGGHQNDNLGSSQGANGGGIVLIKAGTITGNNFSVFANGANALAVGIDGGGGGGGGGVIVINAANFNGSLNLRAKGGKGANVYTFHGPGGGGGGGVIALNTASAPTGYDLQITEGANGLKSDNNNHNAQSGDPGAIFYNTDLPSIDTINIDPEPIDFTYSDTVCVDTVFFQSILPVAYDSLVWHFGDNSSVNDTSSLTDPFYIYSGNGTYTIQLIGYRYCISDTIEKTITIDFANSLTVQDTILCAGSSITLHTTYAGAIGQWSTGSVDSSITISSPGIYTATYLEGSCEIKDSFNVILQESIFNISADTTLCSGESIGLTAIGGSSYSWYPALGLNNANIANPIASPAQSTTYNVIISDACVTDTLSLNITVINSSGVLASGDTSILKGTSAQLEASNGNSYSWTPASSLSCPTCPDPIATPENSTTYYVEILDSNGCYKKDSVTVLVFILCDRIAVPNAFTPNNDGLNDIFSVLVKDTSVDNFQMQIFNRWGEQVFITNSINAGWDGKYKGEGQPISVFAYIINYECDGTPFVYKGNVTLLR